MKTIRSYVRGFKPQLLGYLFTLLILSFIVDEPILFRRIGLVGFVILNIFNLFNLSVISLPKKYNEKITIQIS